MLVINSPRSDQESSTSEEANLQPADTISRSIQLVNTGPPPIPGEPQVAIPGIVGVNRIRLLVGSGWSKPICEPLRIRRSNAGHVIPSNLHLQVIVFAERDCPGRIFPGRIVPDRTIEIAELWLKDVQSSYRVVAICHRTGFLNNGSHIVPGIVRDDIGDGVRRHGIQIWGGLAERRSSLLIGDGPQRGEHWGRQAGAANGIPDLFGKLVWFANQDHPAG